MDNSEKKLYLSVKLGQDDRIDSYPERYFQCVEVWH